MTAGLPVMKNVPTPAAPASVADAAIRKKIFGLGTATLIFSNEDLNDTVIHLI